MPKHPTIAAVIIAKNEAATIADCIRSCTFADEVVVLDSGSDDGTQGIAESLGARVAMRPFDEYAAQRNASLELVAAHDWAFMIDADERCTPELATEVRRAVAAAGPDTVLFRVRRKDMLFGRWLRHASGYPHWFPRLVRPGRAVVVRPINEDVAIDGQESRLHGHLIHYPFAKGMSHWIDRHNRYSSLEAAQLAVEQRTPADARDALQSRYGSWRRWLKQVYYRLPFRPLLAFILLYVVRGGFLDGRAGYQYARMRAMYEYMICLKQREERASSD